MKTFDVKFIMDQVGEDLILSDVMQTFINDRGDSEESTTDYTIKGYVDEMSGEEDLVIEGFLKLGDLICFFDEDETNVAYLEVGNKITRNSKKYRIKNVIHNPGHYEIQCLKI